MSDEQLSQEEIEAMMSGGAQGDAAQAAETDAPAPAEAQAEAAPQETAQEPEAEESPPQEETEPDIRMTVAPEPEVRSAAFTQLSATPDSGIRNGVDLLLDVHLNVAVELGRTQLHVRDILGSGPGRGRRTGQALGRAGGSRCERQAAGARRGGAHR